MPELIDIRHFQIGLDGACTLSIFIHYTNLYYAIHTYGHLKLFQSGSLSHYLEYRKPCPAHGLLASWNYSNFKRFHLLWLINIFLKEVEPFQWEDGTVGHGPPSLMTSHDIRWDVLGEINSQVARKSREFLLGPQHPTEERSAIIPSFSSPDVLQLGRLWPFMTSGKFCSDISQRNLLLPSSFAHFHDGNDGRARAMILTSSGGVVGYLFGDFVVGCFWNAKRQDMD